MIIVMLKTTLSVITFLCVLSLLSQETPPSPSKKSIKNLALKSGVHEVNIRMTNGKDWQMMISVPEKIHEMSEKNMILALHWGVRSFGYEEFMQCLIFPVIDTSKYIVVAPFAEKQAWWDPPKEQQVRRLTSLIREYWFIDKIIAAGYSDGGTGSVHFAAKHSDVIDGAIAMAGFYKYVNTYGVPTYVIHDIRDQLFSYARAKAVMEMNQKNSPDLVFITSERLGHYKACSYVDLFRDGIQWMEEKLAID